MEKKKLKFITVKKHYQILAKQWQMYVEPSRPDRRDIYYYNQLVKIALGKKREARVVILGATPEIRDMLYKYYLTHKIKVICVDMMPEMYQAMTELVTLKIPNEKFIHSDWLKMKFPKNSIDLFIGDLVIGNLPTKENRIKFLEIINRFLKKDGYFITRHWWATQKSKIKNIKTHLFKYVPKVMSEELTIRQAANRFWTDLIVSSWHKGKENATSFIFWDSEIKKLEKYFRRRLLNNHEKIAKEIFQYCLNLITKNRWCYFNQSLELKQLREYFIIKKKYFSNYSLLSLDAPILLLKPKK